MTDDVFDADDIALDDIDITGSVSESTKLDCHCAECDRDFPGSDRAGGHCVVCHMSFTSNSGFDRHKTGTYDTGRRCKTEAELTEANWSCSDDGNKVWRLPGSTGIAWWEKNKNKGENQ